MTEEIVNEEIKKTPEFVYVGVGVLIQNKQGKILLGRRHPDAKSETDNWEWQFPGGQLAYNETCEDCAIREVKERTGLDISAPEVFCANVEKAECVHWITVGLRATKFEGKPVAKNPAKHTEWKWFALDALPENIFLPTAKEINKFKAIKDAKKKK